MMTIAYSSACTACIYQITKKTPNPKCRLYWCLIEFKDWRYSQSCWFFLTSCKLSSLYLLSSSPPPPLPCVTKYRRNTQCIAQSEPTKLLYHPKQNLGGEGASDTAAKSLCWSIFKKSRHLWFGVFIYIWCDCIFNVVQ
jgi:hypothetical protein